MVDKADKALNEPGAAARAVAAAAATVPKPRPHAAGTAPAAPAPAPPAPPPPAPAAAASASRVREVDREVAPPPAREGGATLGARKIIAALGGAQLCYGDPIRAGDQVVIPVARVNAAGGGGWGRGHGPEGEPGDGSGGGGGGAFESAPVGFIAVGPDGTRFEPIPDPQGTARALRTGATAVLALVGAAVLRRRGGARRTGVAGPSARRLLGR